MLDLAPELAQLLQDPRVAEPLAVLINRAVAAALADSAANSWLSATQAARHIYGTDGKSEAFRGLRKRHPELDQMSAGTGKRRRWKRSDLDQFIRNRAAQ